MFNSEYGWKVFERLRELNSLPSCVAVFQPHGTFVRLPMFPLMNALHNSFWHLVICNEIFIKYFVVLFTYKSSVLLFLLRFVKCYEIEEYAGRWSVSPSLGDSLSVNTLSGALVTDEKFIFLFKWMQTFYLSLYSVTCLSVCGHQLLFSAEPHQKWPNWHKPVHKMKP